MIRAYARNLVERFTMLWFIMALGLGGTSVAGFAFLNYTFARPDGKKGLVHLDYLLAHADSMDPAYAALFGYLRHHIAVFGALHLIVLATTFVLFAVWRMKKPQVYRSLWADNTRNAVTIAPALALGMTFNVLLVGGYFYVPWMQDNMQALMPWALWAWIALFFYTMSQALRIQRAHLERGFDVLEMHFGWLLIPFALGMTSVSGAGVAALAKDPTIASTAFLLSLAPFTMALFLVSVKMISIFRSQYRKGLPERMEFLPTFFIIIPITTLIAITLFRYGHFFDHQFEGHLPQAYFALVTAGSWAFELWYLFLGIGLLGAYWRNHLFSLRHFHPSQWGLICPMVAISVLGSFVYKNLLASPVVLWVVVAFLLVDVVVLFWMVARQGLVLVEGAVEERDAGLAAAARAK